MLITRNNDHDIQSIKHFLHTKFRTRYLRDLKFFLGIEVSRSKKDLCISQRKYCLDTLQDNGAVGVKPFIFPMQQNLKLFDFGEPF